MAITRDFLNKKLVVNMKDGDESAGTQTISNVNPDATPDNFSAAGNAILALTGFNGVVKTSTTYMLIQE